jgi:tRNA (guanine37-N1)-methyltransferase
MHFDIFTLFPEMFRGPFDASIIQRAREAGLVSIAVHNVRDYAPGRHHVTDDTPYAGGGGMVMKPEPIWNAVEAVLGYDPAGRPDARPIILLTPQGRVFSHSIARELATHPRLLLICGRYEGVDERVHRYLATDEISIGDYVLSGGEIAAMVLVDAIVRWLPGVLGDPDAPTDDSHASGLLEYPHYTRPAVYRGHAVPDILRSGHHAQVARWRRQEALRRTRERRPDMLARTPLSQADLEFLAQLDARVKQVLVFPSLPAMTEAAATYVASLSEQAVQARGRFNVAFSGGSLPGLLCPGLAAEPLRSRVQWSAWHVFWADERCVPLTDARSNFRLAREYLLDHVAIPPGQIYALDNVLDPVAAADDYQARLARVFQVRGGELPRFDLILLGLGEDGHAASLFPHHPALDETRRWVMPIFDSPKPPPTRITLTLPVINNACHVAFLVAGAGKAEALAQVLGAATSPDALPAQRVRPAHGDVTWFVDEAAAAKLRDGGYYAADR